MLIAEKVSERERWSFGIVVVGSKSASSVVSRLARVRVTLYSAYRRSRRLHPVTS